MMIIHTHTHAPAGTQTHLAIQGAVRELADTAQHIAILHQLNQTTFDLCKSPGTWCIGSDDLLPRQH